jgi:hypothetical protein
MCLVDDRVTPRCAGRSVVTPVEGGVDHHAARNVERRVALVHHAVVRAFMTKDGGMQVKVAVDGVGIWIEQQLVGVPSKAPRRFPGSMDAKAVTSAGR